METTTTESIYDLILNECGVLIDNIARKSNLIRIDSPKTANQGKEIVAGTPLEDKLNAFRMRLKELDGSFRI